MILIASSKKVTTMRKRPIAGRYLMEGYLADVLCHVLLEERTPRRDTCRRALERAYGLSGSLKVSRKSSILLVCSLIASRGLGSLDISELGPPKVF
jgi:hypothetical protein